LSRDAVRSVAQGGLFGEFAAPGILDHRDPASVLVVRLTDDLRLTASFCRMVRPVALLVVLITLLAGAAGAAIDSNDKVRLISVDVQPTVLILGEGSATATARLALRPTDGLGATDSSKKKESHSWLAELRWEFIDQKPAVVSSVTTAVVPPHRYIQLPADPQASSGFTETFIEVQAQSTFEGRNASGQFLQPVSARTGSSPASGDAATTRLSS
jgi:hypothetical protein